MLDKYCEGQPVAYSILKKAIESKTVAHAYLFCAGDIQYAYSLALSFAKTLLCPGSKTKHAECKECSICRRIDNNNFPELKIIEPDGLWVKKEQLLNLQEEFIMKPLEGDKKTYIINGVNKLNVQAANSILKFLEEPEPNIIALLVTSDIHSVLPTIVSRCQVILLKEEINKIDNVENFSNVQNITLLKMGMLYYKDDISLKNFIADAKNVVRLEAIVFFVKKYEAIKLDILLETKKLWSEYFLEKEDYAWALDIMALLYKDVLNLMYCRPLDLFEYYDETVQFVASLNNRNNIIHKLQIILLMKEKIKYNINLNLLMDKLIIEMESGVRV